MIRRLLILLLIVALPLQAVAGMLAQGCRHQTEQPTPMVASAESPCPMHEVVAAESGARVDHAAAADVHPAGVCDDCGSCHHVSLSLYSLPAVLPVIAFTPVRVSRFIGTVISRVPALPERPPRPVAA